MSAVQEKTNIASVLGSMGSMPVPDLADTIREVEDVKTVRFAFHPWMPHNNLGADGFKFNVQHAVLDRLVPIPLPVFTYPEILGRPSSAFAFLGANAVDAVPSSGSRAEIKQRTQTPSHSMTELRTAYGKYGMTELKSLVARDEAELAAAFVLYEAVMGPGRTEEELDAGRRPAGLLLEHFPDWLTGFAPRAFDHAARAGVEINGRRYKVDAGRKGAAEQLIQEVHESVMRAHECALSPSIGILPQARAGLNATAMRAEGGKKYLDNVDLWLLEQFPSFPIDTDVERAQKALQTATQAGASAAAGTNEAVLILAQQMAEQQKTTNKILEMLAKK